MVKHDTFFQKNALPVLFLLLLSVIGKAQQSDCFDRLPTEKVALHLDKNICLAGDSIWFKGYCLQENGSLSTLSKVLYLELFNNDKKVFLQEKFSIQESFSDGAIAIPEELKTGNYLLRAYTQYMRNFPSEIYSYQQISILNPNLDPAVMVTSSEGEPADKSLQAEQTEKLSPEIHGLMEFYGQRSLAEVKLSLPTKEKANLSVVVRKKGLNETRQYHPKKDYKIDSKDIRYLPEIHHTSLSGIVIDGQSKAPVQDVLCLASMIGPNAQLHLASTDQNGFFIFDLPQLEGDNNVFVGLKNNTDRDLELLINNDFSGDFPENLYTTPLLFDSALHQLVNGLYLEKEIRQNFRRPQQDLVFRTKVPAEIKSNVGDADIIIETKDYIDIPTMPELFEEIVPGVSTRKRKGKTSFNIFNGEDQSSHEDPIVLLDNIPVFDIEKLLKIDAARVKNVKVINTNYYLGDFVIDGMIMINTDTDDFAKYQWEKDAAFFNFKGLSPGTPFRKSNYTDRDKKDRNPDFRNILYWNPKISPEDSEIDLQFQTSDMTGEYELIVRGLTESGTAILGSKTFTVKREIP